VEGSLGRLAVPGACARAFTAAHASTRYRSRGRDPSADKLPKPGRRSGRDRFGSADSGKSQSRSRRHCRLNAIPFADETFDIVVADNVLEHLREPAKTFREVHRVLKPGGVFVAKTPNKWHYMPIIARLTPHSFHEWFNQLRGRSSVDTFRTLYRANSRRDIRRLAREAGFEVLALELTEGRPEYLRLTTPTYLLGMIYERGVNSTEWLAGLRILLTVELRKRPA